MALPGSRLIRLSRKPASGEEAPSASELIAALPVPTLLINPEGKVADANAAAELLLNVSRTAIIGKLLDAHVHFPENIVALHQERAGSPLNAFDVHISNDRGMKLLADIAFSPIPDRAGWRILAIHAGAAAHPMGHRREQGSGARAAMGAAAMLAHEIKNPLSGISGAAQLLERKVAPEAREMTRLIRAEVDRITSLIDRMESFTDPRPLELVAENIYPVLDHARALARHGFAQNIEIKAVYDPSLPMALVHRDALAQIVLNLLKNAAEACEVRPDPVIHVVTSYRHGVSVPDKDGKGRRALPIELCIVDNGPGPAPEVADHLFEPFVSTKRSGGGLGLALVDKLVRDMGGIIQFSREGTPERTVFRLLLQRAGKEAR
ncbi:nitrogen regulation protein NR(II) [Sphingomonas sp. LaA6.9]|uniref:two-component system sensor histidine kinase NtrB n=1 Tax=Sphingomonas sp. LaA6.9 TaxID=2919914 RepID=UPI001F4F6C4B|nr:ATP-binding protein [Sphingomonas sp. LaA6.9]MCJ8157366.1 ATP-binding protein [Sphingomonas sp. LaA6.9]